MYLLYLLSEVTSLNVAMCKYLNKRFVYVNCLIQMEHFAGNAGEGEVRSEALELESEPKTE